MTETSLEPGRALLSMASSSASEGCCCGEGGGEASPEEAEEVERNDGDDDGDRSVEVNAAPLLPQVALRESAVRAAATREFIVAVSKAQLTKIKSRQRGESGFSFSARGEEAKRKVF